MLIGTREDGVQFQPQGSQEEEKSSYKRGGGAAGAGPPGDFLSEVSKLREEMGRFGRTPELAEKILRFFRRHLKQKKPRPQPQPSGPDPVVARIRELAGRAFPAYPDLETLGEVVYPSAPRIPEGLPRTEKIRCMARAYRSAVTRAYQDHLRDPRWRCSAWRNLERSNPEKWRHADRMAACADACEAADIQPHGWCMSRALQWLVDHGPDRPPPPQYVFDARMVSTYLSRSAGTHATTLRTVGAKAQDVLDRWGLMMAAIRSALEAGATEDEVRWIAQIHWPGDAWNRAIAASRDEAEACSAHLRELVRRGEWIWPT